MRAVYYIIGFVSLLAAALSMLAAVAVMGKAAAAYVDWFGVFIFAGGGAILAALSWLCFSKANAT